MQPKSHFAAADLGNDTRKLWFSCEKPWLRRHTGYFVYPKQLEHTNIPFTFAESEYETESRKRTPD